MSNEMTNQLSEATSRRSAEGPAGSQCLLTIGVSSRALFHLEREHEIFESSGQVAYDARMYDTQDQALEPGVAFPVVRRLLALNSPGLCDKVSIVVLSRSSPAAGARVMRSLKAHGLNIQKAVFTSGGASRFTYGVAFGIDLFLSAHRSDVAAATEAGIAAAMMTPAAAVDNDDMTLRIAFDGDSVLFSAEADTVFRASGLRSFQEHEIERSQIALSDGPFRRVIEKLAHVRSTLDDPGRLRLALITSRGTATHARAMHTLRSWGIHVDEAVFADGAEKGPLVKAFGACAFFDDGLDNVTSAGRHQVAAGHVMQRAIVTSNKGS